MDKPRIGIIGGAGPMAGALLFEKIIQNCQEKYGCAQDSDFPYIHLLSYPFADMLSSKKNRELVENQLEECFETLAKNGVSIVAIACNTLHAFLRPTKKLSLVHLIEETGAFLREKKWENPLVLCTTTSAESNIHNQVFPCRYPDTKTQMQIDVLIDRVLAGDSLKDVAKELSVLNKDQNVLLGCTELSLLNAKEPLSFANICDPNSVVAEKICRLIYNK